MKKLIKKFWGVIPFISTICCVLIIIIIEKTTGDTLRNIPSIVLTCLIFVSFVFLIIWANKKYTSSKKVGNTRIPCVVVNLINIIFVSILIATTLICLFILSFYYKPEYTVTRNNVKLVASVDSFLDTNVDYYQYKNIFFYGKKLGYEYYGSGSGDPLTETPKLEPLHWAFYDLNGKLIEKMDEDGNSCNVEITENESQKHLQQAEIKKLNIDVINNRENELVFSVSIEDFIDSYNGFYCNDKNSCYLLPTSEWRSNIYDNAIHSNYKTIIYNFTENKEIWSLPTISVYVPTNSSYIQEVTLNFDEHSYTETMYDLYKEICFYTLKVFFPEFENEKIINLYKTLNNLAFENIMPHEQGYSSESIPCSLYYKDGIGLYPYFAAGESVHLCIIPVTDYTIRDFENKGSEIHEIQ